MARFWALDYLFFPDDSVIRKKGIVMKRYTFPIGLLLAVAGLWLSWIWFGWHLTLIILLVFFGRDMAFHLDIKIDIKK